MTDKTPRVKNWSIFRCASMIVQSLVYRYFAQNSREVEWVLPEKPISRSEQLAISWIGHATFLIQIAGINILTDPIFGNASFLYPRIVPPGILLTQLPPIDLVIISHNHHDHMHGASLHALQKLFPHMKIMVPYGDKYWFDSRHFTNVYAFNWWDSQQLIFGNRAIKCTFLPAAHWTQRGYFDLNTSLWGSWMIQGDNKSIYFAGDTAYDVHFV